MVACPRRQNIPRRGTGPDLFTGLSTIPQALSAYHGMGHGDLAGHHSDRAVPIQALMRGRVNALTAQCRMWE